MEISGKNFSSVFGVCIKVCKYVNPYFGSHKRGGSELIYAVFVDFRPLYKSLPICVFVYGCSFLGLLLCVSCLSASLSTGRNLSCGCPLSSHA